MLAVNTRTCCQGTDPCRRWVPGTVIRGQIHAGSGYQKVLSGDISMPAVGTRNCCQGTDQCRRWVPGTVVRGQTNAGGEY